MATMMTRSHPRFLSRRLCFACSKCCNSERGRLFSNLVPGSGWNAALMGNLVGAEGHVYSLELISEVAKTAAETIATLGIKNVNIIAADGGEGYAAGAPYDRAIFTGCIPSLIIRHQNPSRMRLWDRSLSSLDWTSIFSQYFSVKLLRIT
jgi:Protein-L-isoaspartate(D-aspartate) O-methyltransferase (PCMT)